MARYGAKMPSFLAEGGTAGFTFGKLVGVTLNITNAEGELYADNVRAEFMSQFASGTADVEIDDLSNKDAAALYGATLDSSTNELSDKSTDVPPEGKFGFYTTVVKSGAVTYKGYILERVRASRGNESYSTKGSSITFATDTVHFAVMEDETTGEWRTTSEDFTTEAAAQAWLKSELKLS